ncbi:MAG: alpha-L-fucosidase, partial [Planctomycetes bacterium]|nr:alpha-L-fucosidase [Planctomycetota bacterium]
GGGVGQTPDNWDNAYFDDTYFHNGIPEKYTGYCTDVYFQEAKRFITESVRKNKPFMAYIATNAPHLPFHCPDKYWKPYFEKGMDEKTAIFYGMIANIDENVGKMRSWLKKKGLSDNTIFIFMTDNGTASGAGVYNSGMRGAKGSEYEGGHRVPFFVHWPKGKLAHGKDVKPITGHIDVLPTLIDLCGLDQPTDYKFDGRSFASLLRDPDAEWPDRVLITDSQRVRDPIKWRNCSTMTDQWRLVNGTELYDITKDPGQKTDVAKQHPEVVGQLRAEYDAWWADISVVFSKDSRIIVGNKAESPTRLTAHDWLTDGSLPPWHQGSIRDALEVNGEWAIKVEKAGKYRITLRRWPAVVDKAISADLPPGAPVQGTTAYRETPGIGLDARLAGIKIGGIEQQKPVGASEKAVSFEVSLNKGEANLEGYFVLKDGGIIGAYYVYVELTTAETKSPRKLLTFEERFSDDLKQTPDSEARLDKWYRDAKFGAFIHFGVYSTLQGQYKGRGADFHYSEWIQISAKIPAEEYHQVAAKFNPAEFDAEEWVKVFKDAGMRYVVITSKHHDGFALFKSSASPYNIVDATPFKRDIIKELSEACHRNGLKFGVYYSQSQD